MYVYVCVCMCMYVYVCVCICINVYVHDVYVYWILCLYALINQQGLLNPHSWDNPRVTPWAVTERWETPVWYTMYHQISIVKGVKQTPLFINP